MSYVVFCSDILRVTPVGTGGITAVDQSYLCIIEMEASSLQRKEDTKHKSRPVEIRKPGEGEQRSRVVTSNGR